MATSTTQEGIFARELKSLRGKELMEKLNTLKGAVKIEGYRRKAPAIKDPANYGSNKNLLNNCQELPIDKALDALEQELKLIMTNNPWVFSIYTLKKYINEYTDDHDKLTQYIFNSLINCIENLLKRINTGEINRENLYRICSFIYSINMVIEAHPTHITQDCVIIEQACAGESYNELLGTRGTFECVCLAIKDIITGKVYFTHVDDIVTKKSIEDTIALSFPNSNNLRARLFGGKYRNAVTRDNTKKIIDALPSHVKIISSDIGNIELDNFNKNHRYLSPTFIVNPITFEVTNSCPVHLTNNVISSFIQFNYFCEERDIIKDGSLTYPLSCEEKLHMSYTNGQYIPLLITDQFINLYNPIRPLLNQMIWDMENETDTLKKLKPFFTYKKLNLYFTYKILASIEIKKAMDSLTTQVMYTVQRKKKPLSEDNIDKLMKTLKSINLYIGPNASEANKPIFDFIENHLFKDDNTLDLDGLSEIQMGHDSHCYLQPAKDITNPTTENMKLYVEEDMESFVDLHSNEYNTPHIKRIKLSTSNEETFSSI